MTRILVAKVPMERFEALRLVLKQGFNNSTPDLRELAGLNTPLFPAPPRPALPTFIMSSGVDKLTPEERAALPF